MNPFDFVKASGSGDSLMPILIFIFWIAVSIFSNAGKKKKKLAQQRERERALQEAARAAETAPAEPETIPQNEEHRSLAYEEMQQELEAVLSGQEVPHEPVESPLIEDSDFSLETREREEQSYETATPPEVAVLPQEGPGSPGFAMNAYDTLPAGSIESTAIVDAFSMEQPESGSIFSVTTAEARKGIIWSEILDSPLALRDHV
jgi:hypothetical protein